MKQLTIETFMRKQGWSAQIGRDVQEVYETEGFKAVCPLGQAEILEWRKAKRRKKR